MATIRREISFPWASALLKNKAKTILVHGKFRTIGLTHKYRAILKEYVELVGPALQGDWRKDKIWVWIDVEKPDNRSDAINVIDGICDIIKKCIPIDDRYYSVVCDWKIQKIDPIIKVRVEQE